jgi:hypothetical protein
VYECQENWNPRTAEEINANSPQEFYYPFLTIVVLAVAVRISRCTTQSGELETHPPAVEESGFFASFHYTQSSKMFQEFSINTLIDAVVYINKFYTA